MKKISIVLVFCLLIALEARAANPFDSVKQQLSKFEMPKLSMPNFTMPKFPKFEAPKFALSLPKFSQKPKAKQGPVSNEFILLEGSPVIGFTQAKLGISKFEDVQIVDADIDVAAKNLIVDGKDIKSYILAHLPEPVEPDYSKLKIKPEQIEGQIAYALKAGSAEKVNHADRATEADHALKADSAAQADFASKADSATKAVSADSALKADYATKAQVAENATKLIDGEISVSSDNLKIDNLAAKAFVKQLISESQPQSKIDKLLSLEPQMLAPRGANTGAIYLYQEMGQLSLCVYSPANTWLTLAGPVTCPAS